jgi:thiol-disulfide isomerase/thioredoxin
MSKKSIAIALVATAAALALLINGSRRLRAPESAPSPEPVPAETAQGSSAAPDFSLTTLDGRQLRLSDYKGKVILIDFWATWCSPCRTEIPRFVEWQQKYGGEGFQAIGISMDDTANPVRAFYQEFKLNYPVAMGDERVAQAYGGVLGLPVNVLVGRDGRILAKYIGMSDLRQLEAAVQHALQQKSTQS